MRNVLAHIFLLPPPPGPNIRGVTRIAAAMIRSEMASRVTGAGMVLHVVGRKPGETGTKGRFGMADTVQSDAPQIVEPLAAHRIDADALSAWLTGFLPAAAEGLTVRQFQGGMSNPTYLLTTAAGTQYVMRKKPPGKLLPKAHQVDREHNVMAALAGTGVPVPDMIALCEDPGVIGAEFFVMSFVEGRILASPKLETMVAADRPAMMTSLVDTLAALHSVDYNEVGLERFGRPDGYLARQTTRWAGQYEASKSALPADFNYDRFDWLRDWLMNEAAYSDESSIVHGDFRPGNMVTHLTEPKVAAVLDWELSTIGHPLADLAYFCLPYHQPVDFGGMGGIDPATQGMPAEADLLARYAEQTGRSRVEDWPVYLAFSLFRLAAIVQGVAARAAMGNVSSESADAERDLHRAGLMAEIGAGIAARA